MPCSAGGLLKLMWSFPGLSSFLGLEADKCLGDLWNVFGNFSTSLDMNRLTFKVANLSSHTVAYNVAIYELCILPTQC